MVRGDGCNTKYHAELWTRHSQPKRHESQKCISRNANSRETSHNLNKWVVYSCTNESLATAEERVHYCSSISDSIVTNWSPSRRQQDRPASEYHCKSLPQHVAPQAGLSLTQYVATLRSLNMRNEEHNLLLNVLRERDILESSIATFGNLTYPPSK